eukprot:gene55014-73487_t
MRALIHRESHSVSRIGWLRAAVLGANDGIVSTASLIVGVAASGAGHGAVLTAGVAALVAGALSWRFVEVPFRRVPAGSLRPTFATAAAAMVVFAALGMGTSILLSDDARIARFYGPDVAAIRATTAPALSRSECIAVD